MVNQVMTEKRNEKTTKLDKMSSFDVIRVMNEEDKNVTKAVEKELENIEKAIELVVDSFSKGGRLIYIGAGTSGRLGILDAVECPPTFDTDPSMVQGLIAGGDKAIIKAVEGAEDDPSLAGNDLQDLKLTKNDIVIGLAASGQTPYVKGGIEYGNKVGADTVAISCNRDADISKYAGVAIEAVVGPEILTGSTRLKSGTAQKLIINMISTGAMVGIGKVFENFMVDLQVTNQKLMKRAKNIVSLTTNVNEEMALSYLEKAHNNPKIAIVMIKLSCSYDEAVKNLQESGGFVRQAIDLFNEGDK